jgi:hypothetical protein
MVNQKSSKRNCLKWAAPAPQPQAAQVPQQTSMFDNYGQAPAKQEEDDDFPFNQ